MKETLKNIADISTLPLITQLTLEQLHQGKLSRKNVISTRFRRKKQGLHIESLQYHLALFLFDAYTELTTTKETE